MSGRANIRNLNEGVELEEHESGVSTRTVVPLPDQVSEQWDLKYDDYIRISVVNRDGSPALVIAPMTDLSYRERANDLKLTTSDAVALPRRLVRSFSLAGDVWWEEFDQQLIGSLMDYSDAQTLYDVVEHYTNDTVPRDGDGPDAPARTSFADLETIADTVIHYSDSDPFGISTHRGSIRHYVPDGLGLDEDSRATFVLFHDGDRFLIGLLPAPASIEAVDINASSSVETITVSDAYLPEGGSIEVESPDGGRIGHSDQLSSGTHTDIDIDLYEPISEPMQVVLTAKREGRKYKLGDEPIATNIAISVDGDEPEPLSDDYVIHRTGDSADSYSMQYNPLSASPYDYEGGDDDDIPDIILDFEKDAVSFHRDRDGRLYYTVPKQVAACLWLDDGYMTDWLSVGDMYLSLLTPESGERASARADPGRTPPS